jgi:hypothetical protein
VKEGIIKIDNIVLSFKKFYLSNLKAVVTKIAIDPVWWLPGIAKRFNIT